MMEQAVAGLRFAPVLPEELLVGLAIAALLVVALAAVRRARGVVWRLLALAVLLGWLAGPRLVRQTREGLADVALLVVDRTASMQVGDRAALTEQARAALTAEAGAMGDLRWRVVEVPEAGSDGTRLFAAVDRAVAEIPRGRLAGIVALTDGQVHDVPAHPPAAPLHVLVPATGEQIDRRLRIIEAPGYGIVGKPVTIKLAIDDLGVAHPAAAARLTIQRDGEPPVVQSVPVGEVQSIDIPITRGGPTVVDLQAEKLPGEVSAQNNRAVVQINGVHDRLRVLLVSGEPNQGERSWRRLLKADPAVDLVHFTILRPPEKDDLTPLNELALIAFPVRELFQVKIRDFDLIILDRFQNRGILHQQSLRNIADYVRAGGALLMSVGPEYASAQTLAGTALAPVLPALPGGEVIEPFVPAVTELGQRHPVTEGLPGWHAGGPPSWGSWYRAIHPSQVQGQVLMSGPNGDPLLVLERIGQGRAAMLLSDQVWLWGRGHEGGGPQAELLRRIAHWLMKQPELEEDSLSARIAGGRLLVARRSTEERLPDGVDVTDPEGGHQHVALTRSAPGLASASVPAVAPGVWVVSDGTRSAYAASAAANPPEIADLRATLGVLAPVARASGGDARFIGAPGGGLRLPRLRRIEPGQTAQGADWIGLRRNHEFIVTGESVLPLMPSWAALSLILGLILAAWMWEGRATDRSL